MGRLGESVFLWFSKPAAREDSGLDLLLTGGEAVQVRELGSKPCEAWPGLFASPLAMGQRWSLGCRDIW